MFESKFKVVVAAVAAAAALLIAGPADAGKKALKAAAANAPEPSAAKLEGAWVATVVDGPGQWIYTVSPDPSGRHASAIGIVTVGIYVPGLSEMADEVSPFIIDIEMTGKDTSKFNSVWYGLANVSGGEVTKEVVYIGVNWGEIKTISPDRAEGTHHIEFYLPYQDADGDGLPDPGQVPVGGAESHTIDIRLGQH